MFIQLTDRLIVPVHAIRGIYVVAYTPALDEDEEETCWGVEVDTNFGRNNPVTLFKGDREEATQHFNLCAQYLGQCHQRGLIPLHEVEKMVDPSPLQGVK